MSFLEPLQAVYKLGGPVIVLLIIVSILTLSLILYKAWQYYETGIGRDQSLEEPLRLWDQGERDRAASGVSGSQHFMADVIKLGFSISEQDNAKERLESEAEQELSKLENGFRILDTVAQLAPLLGLFGTVLGMIEAFQALQEGGSQVDPAALAGGIWVALLTTAAGLAVAMPTSIALSWFEARIDAERLRTDRALNIITAPSSATVTTNKAA
ncbi:MAG: MotA/TolQ/ExbB proton channel family protein [Pseudomonadota bacterium]